MAHYSNQSDILDLPQSETPKKLISDVTMDTTQILANNDISRMGPKDSTIEPKGCCQKINAFIWRN